MTIYCSVIRDISFYKGTIFLILDGKRSILRDGVAAERGNIGIDFQQY